MFAPKPHKSTAGFTEPSQAPLVSLYIKKAVFITLAKSFDISNGFPFSSKALKRLNSLVLQKADMLASISASLLSIFNSILSLLTKNPTATLI